MESNVTHDHTRPIEGHQEEERPSPISQYATTQLGRLYQSLFKTDPMVEICAKCNPQFLQAHAHHAKALRIASELAKLAGLDLAELRQTTSASFMRPGATKSDKLRRCLKMTDLRRNHVQRLFLSLLNEARAIQANNPMGQESLFFVEILNEAKTHLEHCYKILFPPETKEQIQNPRRAPKTTGHQRIMIAETISRIRPVKEKPTD